MKISDVVSDMRVSLSDVDAIEYSTAELVQYINYALIYISKILINIGHADVKKQVTVTNNMNIPSDFSQLIGKYPIYPVGGVFKTYEPEGVDVLYYANLPKVSSVSDTIALRDEFAPILIYFATMIAGNRNEFDVSQDERLLDRITQLIVGAAK